ncbi:RNA polymerase-binding protein DksA [Bradymonadaceae bacterium TMQ3]|uniref:RNA polymerase-binding protein DksA n=1 Tax=Lujinxingia sediminis TaxID=2480984 RepID=A0ABY0CPS6_9DELT|nr:TraR/DksA C4-type zinc finger protein [Lujinxingia sediminis]RDV38007.1 RNA polymerase-binding protein DksA [Bradymonadaceae bacterium TMQ3]RVU42323.1 RNA polymerase-binding protein DksA [Lujinxingia sediminis]TXC75678.1 RNA polymerase-binding protein DksA [Bradymonadales bacterium TMQ1]
MSQNDDYSDEFLEEMRLALQAQRQDLVRSNNLTRNELRDNDREPRDSIDESTDEQGNATELRLQDRERILLTKVNDAIFRLDTGEYGYCDECGDPIGKPRLRARPMAELCIECKEDQEREERRQHASRPGMFSALE